MITKKQLWRYESLYRGILTNDQANRHGIFNGSLICKVDTDKKVFFFVDKHSFGVDVIPEELKTVSSEFPLRVPVCDEVLDGQIDTIDLFIQYHYKEYKQLTILEELVDFINTGYTPDYRPANWNVGHFPIGTVCEAKVSYEAPFTFTVTGIFKNGVNSYVLHTNLPSEIEELDCKSVNISWVTKIIKRGDGKVKVQINDSGFKEWFAKDQRRDQGSYGITKHRSQYLCFGHVRGLVMNIVYKYSKPEMCLNTEKLMEELFKQGVLENSFVPGDLYMELPYIKCSKKKLNKAVKRLINKCLTPLKVAQSAEKAYYDDMYNEEYFNSMDELFDSGEDNTPEENDSTKEEIAPLDEDEKDEWVANPNYPWEEPVVDSYRASESE